MLACIPSSHPPHQDGGGDDYDAYDYRLIERRESQERQPVVQDCQEDRADDGTVDGRASPKEAYATQHDRSNSAEQKLRARSGLRGSDEGDEHYRRDTRERAAQYIGQKLRPPDVDTRRPGSA